MTRLIVAFALILSATAMPAIAQVTGRLDTKTVKEENNITVSIGTIAGRPASCSYHSYRLEVDPHGQLFRREFGNCGNDQNANMSTVNQAFYVCQLNSELSCKPTVGRYANVTFQVDPQGVNKAGVALAWDDPQRAASLLPTLKSGANRNSSAIAAMNKVLDTGAQETLCPMGFGRLVIQFKRTGQVSSDAGASSILQSCGPKFANICASAEQKAHLAEQAKESKDNSDIKLADIDNFCSAVKPKLH